jgi:hypothetical protein
MYAQKQAPKSAAASPGARPPLTVFNPDALDSVG